MRCLSEAQVLWPRRHHKGTPRLIKSFEAVASAKSKKACPLAAARKERAHSPKAKARARSPTRVKPCCGQTLTRRSAVFNGMLCERPFCRRARASERKKSRVGRLFVSLLKNARAADILHIMHFENHRRQVLVLVYRVSFGFGGWVFLVWFPGRSSGVLLGITSLMCGTPCSRPRMEARVQDFQQFAAKVRWKWHFRGETKAFYINLKNSRHTPPYPRATPPELEGLLSLLRDRIFKAARATIHKPRLQQSRNNVLPLTKHGWKCLKTSCWVAFLNDKDGGFTLVH